MRSKDLTDRELKKRRLIVSLVVFHLLFSAIVLFEAPWWHEFYKDQVGLMIGEAMVVYGFYFLPFTIWHSGDAIQRRPITASSIAWLIDFRFALSCFVGNMLWGLAYAVDIVDVPGAHEFGTLNFYAVYISVALFGLAALVSLAKFGVALFSRFRKTGRQTDSR